MEACWKAQVLMNSFPQLPGEPADAFEQLLMHRDFGPSRQFSQTADVVGYSESTLRRRADQWNWVERLADYDSWMLQQTSEARTKEDLEHYKISLRRSDKSSSNELAPLAIEPKSC